jgi:hypothetical protein
LQVGVLQNSLSDHSPVFGVDPWFVMSPAPSYNNISELE